LLRSLIQTGRWDDVAHERSGRILVVGSEQARVRIHQNRLQLREVSIAPRIRQNRDIAGVLEAALVSFPIRHKEEPVSTVEQFGDPHGPTQVVSILILLEGGLGRTSPQEVKGFGIEIAISNKLEERSMKVVGPGLGRDVDLRRFPPELGGVDPALYFEFLE